MSLFLGLHPVKSRSGLFLKVNVFLILSLYPVKSRSGMFFRVLGQSALVGTGLIFTL